MFQHLKEITTDLVLVCGFSGLCGALSYLFAVEEDKAFTWSSLLPHTTISGACGLITFAVFESFGGFSPTACGAFSGVAGTGLGLDIAGTALGLLHLLVWGIGI